LKDWTTIIACLLLSLGLWLIVNLSRGNSAVIGVPVIAVSNIPGCEQKSFSEPEIFARCKASGFTLLALRSFQSSPREVFFPPEVLKFEGQDCYSIDASSLLRYVEAIFGAGVEVDAFLSPKVEFRFKREFCRKLPVTAVSYASFAPQFMASSEVRLSPDSVLVYGDSDVIDAMQSVQTKPIQLFELRRDAHGIVGLNVPAGLRTSIDEVNYDLPVTRFVEIEKELPVKVRNLPSGVVLSIFPKKVTLRARLVFPLRASFPGNTELFIDYEEFISSKSGECVVNMANPPEGMLMSVMNPQLCHCIEKIK